MDIGSGVDLSEGQTHLDSHADACVCGANFTVLEREDQVVECADVSPFSDDHEPMKDIPIASCATAWVNPEDGEPHALAFHQALHFGDKLDHSPLCPNQTRDNGDGVKDTPKQCDQSSSHGITIQAHGRLKPLFIPLNVQGVVSHLDSKKPTQEELATARFCEVTSDAPWDPHSKEFDEREQSVQVVSSTTNMSNSKRLVQAAHLQKIAQSRNLSVCSSRVILDPRDRKNRFSISCVGILIFLYWLRVERDSQRTN